MKVKSMSEVRRKNKLLKYVGQKGFVHETGCFNNVHILKEAIKATKQSKGLVAIELDAAKPFVSVSCRNGGIPGTHGTPDMDKGVHHELVQKPKHNY
jgi:hypothetical protein